MTFVQILKAAFKDFNHILMARPARFKMQCELSWLMMQNNSVLR